MIDSLDQIDLANPDNYVERIPFEWFDTLRREQPVVWHPERAPNHGFWAVTRHDDLTAIHMDWETFSSELGAVGLEDTEGKARSAEHDRPRRPPAKDVD